MRAWPDNELLDELPDRVRLPFSFDAEPLAADLAAFEESDWTAHFVRDNYEGEWSALPLRAAIGETHPIRQIGVLQPDRDYADTLYLDRAPAVHAALAAFHCPLNAVRLMRLGPGSRIREHSDPELDAKEGWARLHVPLVTHPGVRFMLAGARVEMTAGSVWYLRLTEPHSVDNPGPGERVHLVIEAVVNDWLAEMLDEGRLPKRLSPGSA